MLIDDLPQYANLRLSGACPVMLQMVVNPVRNGPGVIVQEDQNF